MVYVSLFVPVLHRCSSMQSPHLKTFPCPRGEADTLRKACIKNPRPVIKKQQSSSVKTRRKHQVNTRLARVTRLLSSQSELMWDYVVIPAASPDGGQFMLGAAFLPAANSRTRTDARVCLKPAWNSQLGLWQPPDHDREAVKEAMQMEDTWVASEEATLTWLTESQWKFWRI